MSSSHSFPLSPLVQLQLVIDEPVCESNGAARVCVQLGTDTEREVTATVQTSDISARSESCMVVLLESLYLSIVTLEVNLSTMKHFQAILYNSFYPESLHLNDISNNSNRWIRLHYFYTDLQFSQPIFR